MAGQTRFNHVVPISRSGCLAVGVLLQRRPGFRVGLPGRGSPTYAVVFRDEVYIHLSSKNPPGFEPGGGERSWR